jgi:hypothetical protein
MYKNYCEDVKVPYPLSMRTFKSELKSYFENYDERIKRDDSWVRSYYSAFKTDIFNLDDEEPKEKPKQKEIKNNVCLNLKNNHLI